MNHFGKLKENSEEELLTYIQEQRQNAEKNKQLFLERLGLLFDEIKTWNTDDNLQIEQQQIEITEEIFGTYAAPKLFINNTKTSKPLVDISPVYGFSIVAEGLVSVTGELGKEYIAYLRWGEQTLYNVNGDTWYWMASFSGSRVYRMNKTRLLQLITKVSGYSFIQS
ncbi:hypothetical protein BGP_0133 [Beggiatoa sp. PS]|nr:hypothetical protein BGP_0133 [Beggiatoa sp. PS]